MITTAGVASIVLYDLASRMDHTKLLLQELQSNEAKHGREGITMDLFDDSPRLQAFTMESMRKGAVVFLTARAAIVDNVK